MIQPTQKDERILTVERQINSNAFHMAVALWVLALLVKAVFFQQAVRYTDQMLYIDAAAMLIPTFYVFLANIRRGNDSVLYNKRHVLASFVLGILVALLILLRSSHPDQSLIAGRAVLGFVVMSVLCNGMFYVMGRFSRQAARRREEALLEED